MVGVREGVVDELADMVVGEPVVDVFAVAAALDEAGLAQRLEALADGRKVRLGVGELADTTLAVSELAEDLEALSIGERAKEIGGPLEALRVGRDGRARRVFVLVGNRRVGFCWATGGWCLHHFNNR